MYTLNQLQREQLRKIVDDGTITGPQLYQLKELVKINPYLVEFPVVVDYDQSLKKAAAKGKYSEVYAEWAKLQVQKNAYHPESGRMEVSLLLVPSTFPRDKIYWDEDSHMISHLRAKGLRPATAHELLAFGAAYPNMQMEYPIIAVGELFNLTIDDCTGYPVALTLDMGKTGRTVSWHRVLGAERTYKHAFHYYLAKPAELLPESYRLVVNYDEPAEAVCSVIHRCTPTPVDGEDSPYTGRGTREVDLRLIRAHSKLTIKQAQDVLYSLRLRSATWRELLQLEQIPIIQRSPFNIHLVSRQLCQRKKLENEMHEFTSYFFTKLDYFEGKRELDTQSGFVDEVDATFCAKGDYLLAVEDRTPEEWSYNS